MAPGNVSRTALPAKGCEPGNDQVAGGCQLAGLGGKRRGCRSLKAWHGRRMPPAGIASGIESCGQGGQVAMPTKPDYTAEELATRLIDVAEAQRAALIAELRLIHDMVSTGSVLAPPAGRLLRLVSAGAFLSSRLSQDIQTAVDSGELDKVLGELELLQCLGGVRETSRALCAYFLKYRFIDLSDLTLPAPDRAGVQRPMERLWQLPEGTDTLWTDMRSAAESKARAMLPSRVTAVPWLGNLRPSDILQAIVWLTEIGLLEFAHDDCVEANERPVDAGVAVLRLNNSFRPADPEVQREYEDAVRRTLAAEIRRHKLVEDLGTGLRTVGAFETIALSPTRAPMIS